jgi:riboflavin synthase
VDKFCVQLSSETLDKTTVPEWHIRTQINLETALHLGDELGGHLLSGHVDGTAHITEKELLGESLRYVFEVPKTFAKFIAPKGSIALNGVSLTVNDVDGENFAVNIIPHTQKMTTFGSLAVGNNINFEVDIIARYVERMMTSDI